MLRGRGPLEQRAAFSGRASDLKVEGTIPTLPETDTCGIVPFVFGGFGTGTGSRSALPHARNPQDRSDQFHNCPREVVARATVFCHQPPPMIPARPLLKGVAPELHGHGERILHVDDEPGVTAAVQRILQRLGYLISVFNSPTAAIEAFQGEPHSFDLIITDLMMPGMNGFELATAARSLRPRIPLVLLSAMADAQQVETIHALGFHSAIMKPASVAAIAGAVRRALDSSNPPP